MSAVQWAEIILAQVAAMQEVAMRQTTGNDFDYRFSIQYFYLFLKLYSQLPMFLIERLLEPIVLLVENDRSAHVTKNMIAVLMLQKISDRYISLPIITIQLYIYSLLLFE